MDTVLQARLAAVESPLQDRRPRRSFRNATSFARSWSTCP